MNAKGGLTPAIILTADAGAFLPLPFALPFATAFICDFVGFTPAGKTYSPL